MVSVTDGFLEGDTGIVVLQAGGNHLASSKQLAASLSLPHVDGLAAVPEGYWFLHYSRDVQNNVKNNIKSAGASLCLSRKGDSALLNIGIDLAASSRRLENQASLRSELLIKAVGGVADPSSASPQRHIIDATAGMATDSLLLASAGHRVSMVERSPIVAALIEDALSRANNGQENLRLYKGDGCVLIDDISQSDPADIIYLDPMFPEKKKSALSRKGIQSLKQLLTEPEVDALLLGAALECAKYRVVVKRPLKAPEIDGPKPGFSLKGKLVRYDCYSIAKLQ